MAIITQRNGNDRRGVNGQETVLNPANVNLNTFGSIGNFAVDGPVYAQPLHVPRVKTAAGKPLDLVIVATMNNSVFAFDAGAAKPSKAQVWKNSFGSAVSARQFMSGGYRDIVDNVDSGGSNTHPATIGILSTPVIDANIDPAGINPTTGVIYAVSFTGDQQKLHDSKDPGAVAHFLHAISLEDGKEIRRVQIAGGIAGSGYQGSPSGGMRGKVALKQGVSSATVKLGVEKTPISVVDARNVGSPNAVVQFNSIMQLQRPALLLTQGKVIIAFGSRGDENPYHGWIFAYDAQTFQLVGLTCTTPNGGQGGIWQAGQGLLTDSKGNIYAGTGNGDNSNAVPGTALVGRNLSESFIQLRLDATGIHTNAWFNAFGDFSHTPETGGDVQDDDLGASAPALLPDDRIAGGGKDGWLYLIDPDLLDQNGSDGTPGPQSAVPQAFKASFNFQRGSRSSFNNNNVDTVTHHIHGTPVVWNSGASGVFVYVWGENDVLRVYQYSPEVNGDPTTGRFIGQPANFDFNQPAPQGVELARGGIYASNELADRNGMPGGMLSLSWDGVNASSALLWAQFPPFDNGNQKAVPGCLAAFNASSFDNNLGFKRLTMVWNSRQNPADDLALFAKFCCPTIANGRVYQASGSNRVVVYGLKPADGGYNIGFGGTTGLALNGTAIVTKDKTIVLTEHAHKQFPNGAAAYTDPTPTFNAGSFFSTQLVNITKFVTSFTFRLINAAADGFTFTIQAEGPNALGSPGSGLGCMIDPVSAADPTQQGFITRSLALKFVLGDPDNTKTSHMGLLLNGAQFPGFVDVDLKQGPVLDLRSGNPIKATLRYNGNILFVQLTDTVLNITTPEFQLLPGNIAQQIHSITGRAFVGFTGGTGGRSARQEILKWEFTPGVFI
jgi:hypothetical protein